MFRLHFNATNTEPIHTFTAEWREEWLKEVLENLADYEVEWLRRRKIEFEAQKRQKFLDDMHEHYMARAGGNPKVVMSVAQAKQYVRLRASESLRAAFECMENVLAKTSNAPLKDQLDVAYEIIKRAVGPASVTNAVRDPNALTELAPMDAVDVLLKAHANGEVDEGFVKTALGILGAKVNALKVEQELDRKSAANVTEKLSRPRGR